MTVYDRINEISVEIFKLGNSRALSLAMTKLEECELWLRKHENSLVVSFNEAVQPEEVVGVIDADPPSLANGDAWSEAHDAASPA